MLFTTILATLWAGRALAWSGISEPFQPQLLPRDYINTTGLTTLVGWDGNSFFINGSRIFLQSGEFHQWRLPVPGLWKDVLQKIKAAGLNAISIYTHWALTNPKSGEVDFTGINDLQALFDAAREVGLWVIARPGPYIKWIDERVLLL